MEKLDGLCDGIGDDGTGVPEEDYLDGLIVQHPKEGFHAVACVALGDKGKKKKDILMR